MLAESINWGHWFTISMMSIALGMDAFSLGIGVGLQGIRYREIFKISTFVSLFHVIMPFIGLLMGKYMGYLFGHYANYFGGGILFILGVHMLLNSWNGTEHRSFNHKTLIGIILFALMVSIDSIPVGVSLGNYPINVWIIVILFGMFGGMMSSLGLLIGRKLGTWVGAYAEIFAGFILAFFGLHFCFDLF